MGRIGKPILLLDIEEIYKNLYQLSVYTNPDLLLILVYTNPDKVNNVSKFANNLGFTTPHQIWDYMFELLLRCGYDVTDIPPYNRFRIKGVINVDIYRYISSGSMLHFAVQFNNTYALRVLVSKYPHLVNCMNDRYITPLGLAIIRNNFQHVKLLLDNGADIDAAPDKYKVCHPNILQKFRKYKHIILRALKSKDTSPDMIELVLSHSKKKLVYPVGKNVLHYIFSRKTESVLPIVEVMAKYYGVTVDELINSNIDKPGDYHVEPYMLAALYGITDILDKYSTKDRVNNIWDRITDLSDDVIKRLLPYMDVNKPLRNGNKLIKSYIDTNNYDMVYLLIDHGAILTDEDFYKIKDKTYRNKIIEYYYSHNQPVKQPTELWKLACDTKDQRYIGIIREGLRYLKGDAWLSTHDTYDDMCIYLHSDEFKSDIDKYRSDVLAKIHNPYNEYDLIDTPLWYYNPNYIVCFNGYCFGVQEVVNIVNKSSEGWIFRNPYTNEVSVISDYDYNRYLYMSKQDPISPIGKMLDIVRPHTIRYIPKHEKLMQLYNSKTNNSLNENYIVNLANTLNLDNIVEFFDNILQYIDVNPYNLNKLSNAVDSSDPELVIIAIVKQLLSMRNDAEKKGVAPGFDLIVSLITNGNI